MSARLAPIGPTVLAAVLVAGCQAIGVDPGPTVLRGSVYTDMEVGMPCTEAMAPRELAGIGLRFLDASGRELGSTVTERVTADELPGGADGDDAGCRFAGPYSITLPTVPSYTVEFNVPDPPERGGYFSGTDELRTQTLSREELAGRNFDWSFELPPSFVVP